MVSPDGNAVNVSPVEGHHSTRSGLLFVGDRKIDLDLLFSILPATLHGFRSLNIRDLKESFRVVYVPIYNSFPMFVQDFIHPTNGSVCLIMPTCMQVHY